MKAKILSPYDWFLIIGVVVSNILYSVLSGNLDIIGSVAGIAGVLCVVLVAKGSIWNYLFGIVNVSMYAYISYRAALYGDAALNALYYVPMQFIGYYAWKRRGASISSDVSGHGAEVKARRLSSKQRILLGLGSAAAILLVAWILDMCGDGQPLKDSTTTVLSIIAQALMAMAFMEQWVLWILTNIVSVVMWVLFVIDGKPHAAVMVIMWSFYLLNSINGLRIWLRLSREPDAK
jgi:nicotinamide mononucleotide transporter